MVYYIIEICIGLHCKEMNISGYKIEKQIGAGGMAKVYLATQESLGRPVALKVMNPFYSDSPEFSARFLEEGRILASIQHLNIITIHDIGISAGLYFISMEYVEGGDLQQRIKNGINLSVATHYLETLASCLDVAHDMHIVHRDIKPTNILFRRDGSLLLTDFGIAKQLTVNKELTMVGSMIGSPHYISPEQAQGAPVDGRADIYSLGIVYYEMLTGKRPYGDGSAIEIADQHISQPLPDLPGDLAAYHPLIERMTRKVPEERFPSCKSLLAAIQELKATGQWSGQVQDIPLPELPIDISIKSASTHFANGNQSDANSANNDIDDATLIESTLSDSEVIDHPHFNRFLNREPLEATHFLDALKIKIKRQNPWIAGTLSIVVIVLTVSITMPYKQKNDVGLSNKTTKSQVDLLKVEKTDSGLSLQDKEKIDQLIQNAELALHNYRLTTPVDVSAHSYYQQILQLAPENQTAQHGMHQIAEAYYHLANKAETDWDYAKANQYVKQGLLINPDNKRLLNLKETLQAKIGTTGRSFKNTFKGVKEWFE